MTQLFTRLPKRFFAFGCSFTKWAWPTWADIISCDLKIPIYNYGRGGAGNQFIFNTIMQADNRFHFTNEDLVMVCWTNVSREDRYASNQWWTPGNIYSQNTYDSNYIEKWADPLGYCIRDFATIKVVSDFLDYKNIPHHFLKMIDMEILDQWNTNTTISQNGSVDVIDFYRPYLEKINRSFYDILWNNNLSIKFQEEQKEIGPKFKDGHPTTPAHLKYLETVFDHKFRDETKGKISQSHQITINALRNHHDNFPNDRHRYLQSVPAEAGICREYYQDLKMF